VDEALEAVGRVARDLPLLGRPRFGFGAEIGMSSESMDDERRFNEVGWAEISSVKLWFEISVLWRGTWLKYSSESDVGDE